MVDWPGSLGNAEIPAFNDCRAFISADASRAAKHVERVTILSDGVPLDFSQVLGPQPTLRRQVTEEIATLLTRDELRLRERESIVAALDQAGGKVSGSDGAAALLGMKPTTLYSRILALGLRAKASANTNARVAQASF